MKAASGEVYQAEEGHRIPGRRFSEGKANFRGEYVGLRVLGEWQGRLRDQLSWDVRGLEYPAPQREVDCHKHPVEPRPRLGSQDAQRCQSDLPMPLCF